jgi:ferritin-like metal-binding protein YciE
MRRLVADSGASEPISLGAALEAGKKVAPDATRLLGDDHRVVIGWFDWYERSDDATTRKVLTRRICAALRAHMAGEEKWFYPAAQEALGDRELIQRALDEHGQAKTLIKQLERKRTAATKQRGLMRALRDEVAAHIAEEELELFPAVRAAELDLYAVGRAVAAERVQQLFRYFDASDNTGDPQEVPQMQIAQDQARELFTAGLKNAHAMAREGHTMLETQVKRLEQYPALQTKFRSSLAEKESQLARIETLLERGGENRSAFKDAVMNAAAGIAGLASAAADDEVIKNSFGMLAHARMSAAAYETLILFGEASGETSAALRPLQQSLSEERGLASFIEQNLRPTGIRFMQLRSQGGQASQ